MVDKELCNVCGEICEDSNGNVAYANPYSDRAYCSAECARAGEVVAAIDRLTEVLNPATITDRIRKEFQSG